MYLSTSDYVQHTHTPGDEAANAFYAEVDRSLAAIDRLGAALVVTADHGMNAKADRSGAVNAVYLQDALDDWLRPEVARVILPVTDPYVVHHGSLGSCGMVYLSPGVDVRALADRIQAIPGVDVAVPSADASIRFELPADRIGDIVVFTDASTVVGTRPADHDLSALQAPLRSHGGREEQKVPMFTNRAVVLPEGRRLRNFDAFEVALNLL
jgi:phosphonoacetate hydrolase